VALITTREIPDKGQQLFLHYLAGDVVMEQTRPTEQEFRWALVPNRPELVERLLGILPVQETESGTEVKINITQDQFLTVKELVEGGNVDQAHAQLAEHGLSGEPADVVIETIANPKFAGMVAVLQCEQDEIVDARNLMVIQGEAIALLLRQVEAGSETLELVSCDVDDLRSQLTQWIYELSKSAEPG
jgi:hypothetical protein